MNDNDTPNLKDMYRYVVDHAQGREHLPFKERYRRVVQTKVFKDVEYLFLCRVKAMLLVPLSIVAFATVMKVFFYHLDTETNQKISVFLVIYAAVALVISWRSGTRYALNRIRARRMNKNSSR